MKILNLDTKMKNINLGQVEKCDTVQFMATLEDKDYSNSIVRILGKKSDKTFVEQIVEVQDNKIDCILKEQFTACEGITKVEINIVENGYEWTSNENYFYISNTLNGEIIESKDSIDTLEKVDKFVEAAITELDEFEVIKNDLNVANETMKVDEEARNTNEIIRNNSENLRVDSEKERTLSEEERVENELERVTSENNRKTSESNRKLAEVTRNSNEATRVLAEENRQATFEENEKIRNSNENIRIANEIKRENSDKKHNSNEATRKINETARNNAEETRKTAEATRSSNENTRVENENLRQETYTNFNEAEVNRKANEATRIESEKLRVAAEEKRQSAFNTSETNRQATFEENETDRANTFSNNESTRQNEFEADEITRMNTFNSNEKARAAIFERNENVREAIFVQAETTRDENEAIRKNNETSRKTSETKRVNAEKTRVESETTRSNAEATRNENEETRTTAETARVEAEKVREQRFEEMEGSSALFEITKEVNDAKGDKETLKLKLVDMENRAAENVAKQYLEVATENGSLKVENCYNGLTKDLSIKGRTLQNICPFKFPFASWSGGASTWMHTSYHNFPLLQQGKVYSIVVFGNISDFSNCRLGHANSLSPQQVQINELGKFVKFTAQEISSYGIGLIINKNKVGFTQEEKDSVRCIILEGEPQYIPPYFEGIKSLGEEDSNRISILATGKNLINLPKEFERTVIDGKNVILVNNFLYEANFTKNTRYTIEFTSKYVAGYSTKILFNYTDGTSSESSWSGQNFINYKIFSDENKSVKNIEFKQNTTNNSVFSGAYEDNIFLYEGTTATPYEPYKQDKKDILIPVSGGAKGLGNVADEIFDNGDYLQRIGVIKLTSSSPNKLWSNRDNKIGRAFDISNIKPKTIVLANSLKCYDLLIYDSGTKQHEGIQVDSIANSVNISLEASDLNDFNSKLDKLDLTVYYELAEPILHKATEPTDINLATFKDITHVSCLNKIAPSSMSAKFPVDTAATFSRLNRENKELELKNIELKKDLIEQAEYFTQKDREMNDYTLDVDFKVCLMEMDLEDIKLQLGDGINVKK